MFQVDYSQAGSAQQASPSIWKDCPGQVLNINGLGFYFHDDFIGGGEVFADSSAVGNLPWTNDADASSSHVHRTGGTGGLQDLAVSGTDNNAIAIFSQPLGKMVRNSGNKIWFEIRYNPVSITEDRGVYFGFTAEAGMVRDVLADDVASVAAGLIGNDLLGFTTQTDNKDDLQAVSRKAAAAPVVMLANVTQAPALGSAAAPLVAGTFRKIGLKFDGAETIQLFVDGIKVSSYSMASTQFPTTDMAAIVAVKTGAAATATIDFDWVRFAVQNRR